MFPKKIFAAITALALVSMACSITVNLPVTEVKTGPTVRDEISILPDENADVMALRLGFGAGELNLDPGAGDKLVAGTATYNVSDLKPVVTRDNRRVKVETGSLEINGFPSFKSQFENTWDFQLGEMPMDLEINAGAYRGRYEFGGLSLHSLKIADGAADVVLTFSDANPEVMSRLRYDTGASRVEMVDLANANFEELVFKGGVGDYTLDFGGKLQRDATVMVDAGLSNVTVIVPAGTAARVFVDSGLANVNLDSGWDRTNGVYTISGAGPRLTINVNIGAGNLDLRSR